LKIVLAPDSFKGSLTAKEVCSAMTEGVRRYLPETELISVPMADGGEGTVQALVDATGGRIIRQTVIGPIGDLVDAFFGVLGDGITGVIEMAAASGLPLVPLDKRDPRFTTTYGTGQLIKAALDAGCTRLLLGIGGSATIDGGAGMAQALGYSLLDRSSHELPLGGAALANLHTVDTTLRDARLDHVEVIAACDVNNPLLGPIGASAVFGSQKGATSEMIPELDAALTQYADVVEAKLGVIIRNTPGTGAAGGLGAGLIGFLNTKLQPGIELVAKTVGLREKLAGADLVITGEGRLDGQTIHGKTPVGVGRIAKELDMPVLAVAGSLGPEYEKVYLNGIDGVISITNRPMELDEAIKEAYTLVADATERIMRIATLRIIDFVS
jgi:glycerate kinase